MTKEKPKAKEQAKPVLTLTITNTSAADETGCPARIIAYDQGIETQRAEIPPQHALDLPWKEGRTFGVEPVLPEVPADANEATTGAESGVKLDSKSEAAIKKAGDTIKKSLLGGKLTKS